MTKPLPLHSDEFMRELTDDKNNDVETLDKLVDALPPAPVPANLEYQVMAALPPQRFDRFTNDIASLLDIDISQAQERLNGIDKPKSWEPGLSPEMELYHVEGGPAVKRAITGFIRLKAGSAFPVHKHLGDEVVMVIQGYFKDGVSGQVYGPGDIVRMPAQSEHSFEVLEGGTDLTYLAIVQEGLEIAGEVFNYDDPRM